MCAKDDGKILEFEKEIIKITEYSLILKNSSHKLRDART